MRRRLIWQASHRSASPQQRCLLCDKGPLSAQPAARSAFGRGVVKHKSRDGRASWTHTAIHGCEHSPDAARASTTPARQGDRGAVRPPARVRAVKTRANLGARNSPPLQPATGLNGGSFQFTLHVFKVPPMAPIWGCWTGPARAAANEIRPLILAPPAASLHKSVGNR